MLTDDDLQHILIAIELRCIDLRNSDLSPEDQARQAAIGFPTNESLLQALEAIEAKIEAILKRGEQPC